jgi:uncharacterized protein YjdB
MFMNTNIYAGLYALYTGPAGLNIKNKTGGNSALNNKYMKYISLVILALSFSIASFATVGPITGTMSACVGGTSSLSDTTAGGTWTSSDPGIASVDAPSGVVTGITAGTVTITYTAGTYVTTTFIVNPLPLTFPLTAGVYCSGGTGVHIILGGSESGFIYQLYNGATPVGAVVIGTGSSIDFGLYTTAGSYTVTSINPSAMCASTSGPAILSINPLPNAYSVTGGGSYCPGGVGVPVGLNNSNIGINYQLYNGAVPVGTPVAGTGLSISFGNQTAAGTYTVVATNATTGCTNNMTGSATATLLAGPAPITGSPSMCIGVATAFSDGTPGGTWSCSNPVIATINPSTGLATGISAGTAVIYYTIGTGCSSSLTITVNTMPGPIGGPSSVCVGLTITETESIMGGVWGSSNPAVASISMGVITGVSIGTANIIYSLGTGCSVSRTITVNATPVISGSSTVCVGATTTLSSTGGGTWSSAAPAIATIGSVSGVVTGVSAGTTDITYILPTGCSGYFTVTVNPSPALFSVTGGGDYCAGGTGKHVGLSGSQTGVNYQLYLGIIPVGSPIAGTGSALDFGLFTAAGTYTVKGTFATTGCAVAMTGSVTIVINPLPVISGPTSVCSGNIITWTGSPSGGSWISNVPAVATIGPITGMITGVSVGTTIITYTLPTGCYTTSTVTVTPGPTAISGATNVCQGYTTTLSDGVPGGTWTSSNTAVATIGSISGVVTGITSGTTTIYYSLGTGCTTYAVVTVLSSPAAITGVPNVCIGATTNLGDATPGGTWSSSNIAVATVSGGGVVTGISAGTVLISYTAGTGCFASAAVTVNPLPALHNAGGGGSYCSGGPGIDIYLDGSDGGVFYQLYNGGSPEGSPVPGFGGPLDFGFYTAAGIYTVVGTNSMGCHITMSGSATISISPLPTAYLVTGGGGYCSGGTGVHIGTSGSSIGVNYQLFRGVSPVGAPLSGTGSPLDFGLQTSVGTYTVVATDGSTGCTGNMTGSATVSIYALPTVYTVTGGGAYCSGGTGSHIYLSGSQTGVTYKLYRGVTPVGAPVYGTGVSIDMGAQTVAGIYTVVASNPSTSCTNNMAGSLAVSINPLPTIHTVTGGGTFCYGGAGIPVGLDGSNTGISYQLFNGITAVGGPITGTGSPLDFGLQTLAGTYTVTATNTSTGCAGDMLYSATITVTTAYMPVVTISASPGDTVCPGTRVTFTATPTYGGSSPTYTWFLNGVAVSPADTFSYFPSNGDVIYCVMNSNYPCRLATTVTSNVITMAVNIMPAITGPTSVCIGSTITLADATLGGTWTSSNPPIAIVATVGGSTGVVSGISTGMATMTYMLGTGCYATVVVTVNPVPTVLASPTAGCSMNTTLTASGAATYLWTPSAGLSCSTCAVTIANPAATTNYMVTGTNILGCSQTATVLVNGNRVAGHIAYSGTPSDTLKVWLIHFNPSDSSIYALDSTLTCMDGGIAYYEFDGEVTGDYMVKAKLLGTIPGTSGYVPTYSLSTPHWDMAASVAHTSGTDTLHIDMVYGTVPPGPGFIGGLVSTGAGKGTAGDVPAVGMLIFLKDAGTGNVVTFTYTDATGAYAFKNLAHGNYIVYPEDYAYYTVPSASVSLIGTADSANTVNFKQHTSSKTITPILPNSIASLTTANDGMLVYPNPTTGVLNIQWGTQATGMADVWISDVTGRSVYKTTIDLDAMKTIYKTTPRSPIDLGGLKDGIYFISIKAGLVNYNSKFMIAQ